MIPALVALSQVVPWVAKYFKSSDNVISTVVEKASQVVGSIGGGSTLQESITNILGDAEKLAAVNLEIKRLEVEWDKIYLEDIQSAREMTVKLAQAGQKNYMAISMYILAVIVIIGLMYYVIADESINEYARGLITFVLGRFAGYLDNIYNFEFGTTRQSRAKDETISNLSK